MKALLQDQNLTSQHIISITLLLKDMSDFTVVNPIYASYFTSPLPPSRVTISTCIPERVRLSAIVSSRRRTGLHVQSRSYWAPANIGPYSQSISVYLCLMKLTVV
jgi:diphthine-ammonia ligase